MSEDIDWKAKFEEGQADRQAFEEHYKNAVIRLQVKIEAASWGVDPDLAALAVDISGCRMDEKTDEIYGVREAIQDLAARKPYLFAPKERGIPPPPKREDGFLALVQKELGFKKF